MKNTLIVLTILCAAQVSAQTVVQQFVAISRGAGTVSDMDLEPTAEGSTLIAMPFEFTPGVKVLSVTDNAPAGGNTYKEVPGSVASCAGALLDIWYCEKCNAGVTELKFQLSGNVLMSLNAFVEVSGLQMSSVLDGEGAHVTDGTRTSDGLEVGPKIKTSANDFIIARFSSAVPMPTAAPAPWIFKPSYAYLLNGAPGAYTPTLTGGGTAGNYCMSVAAFKAAASAPASPAASQK
ncbi:MAG TPA: hypothetical protein VE957_21805 [Terriglobales bacterium]|nr:hypothetical protein [Terriglobales bacterium]